MSASKENLKPLLEKQNSIEIDSVMLELAANAESKMTPKNATHNKSEPNSVEICKNGMDAEEDEDSCYLDVNIFLFTLIFFRLKS